MLHSPVLLEESIDFLITNPSGKYIDATFGRGGHSRKILDSISKDGELLALDKDIEAIRFAEENFKENNFSIQHAGFGLGVERFLCWICGIQHVRESIPFPRTINRLDP